MDKSEENKSFCFFTCIVLLFMVCIVMLMGGSWQGKVWEPELLLSTWHVRAPAGSFRLLGRRIQHNTSVGAPLEAADCDGLAALRRADCKHGGVQSYSAAPNTR